MKRVTFVSAILTHYRAPFHERLRALLAARDIEYRLVVGAPDAREAAKGDTVDLPWATRIATRSITVAGRRLLWQPALREAFSSDLVILGQENKNLLNYPLQLLPRSLRPRLALFGHGRNFQAVDGGGPAEAWKRWWARRCDHWFGYTEATRRHLLALGWPDDRITVFRNAVDTTRLRTLAAEVDDTRRAERRRDIGLTGDNVAVYVGGLYAEKRPEFLIAAADEIRRRLPDFELLVIGGGEAVGVIDAAAATRPWLHSLGPRFDRDKVELMSLGRLFLMPGLLGLAVLDAFALGLPVVTTDVPWHSPEVAYLDDGATGLVVSPWRDVEPYAEAVVSLLEDEPRLTAMAATARRAADDLTIEAMAERFADGIVIALERD